MALTANLASVNEDSHTDQERDANAQLLELDKGLRSTKVGEQCEAIVRFPRLFEKYPFPIIVNAAFLKLGDVFRTGSNFLRLCILKVSQQSTKHLDKIHSVDEYLRRLFVVTHSNDPVARSIAIRTLGSCAPAIPDRKNVHDLIINALDSHDNVELEAGIYAADKYAAVSKSFSTSIANKLAEMIEDLHTPVDIKLKMIPLFEHMYHDTQLALRVRDLCENQLPSYPARGFVLVTLHTLTLLSAKYIMDIPKQVQLLLDYMKCDPRRSIKTLALKDLKMLAVKGPHMWTQQFIEDLSKFVLETPFNGFKLAGLDVLTSLSQTLAVSKFSTLPDSYSLGVCTRLCSSDHAQISSQATFLFVNIAVHKEKGKEDRRELIEEVTTVIETLVVTMTMKQNIDLSSFKICLLSAIHMCRGNPAVTDQLVDLMMSCLPNVSENCGVLLCQCMASLSTSHIDTLPSLVPDLLQMLKELEVKDTDVSQQLRLSLITLLFQAFGNEGISAEIQDEIVTILSHCNSWTVYRVARQAARYGHHAIAALIFGQLSNQVASEQHFFWMNALRDLSLAECSLSIPSNNFKQCMNALGKAQTFYQKAISSFQAGTTCSNNLESDFVQLRSRMLKAHIQLAKSCHSFQSSPPPAIATSKTMTTGQEVHKYAHVVNQLKNCKKQFETISSEYSKLYQMSFDSDKMSLETIQIQQQSCQIMMSIIESFLNNFKRGVGESSALTSGIPKSKTSGIEHQRFCTAFEDVSNLLTSALAAHQDAPLTHVHIQCLLQTSRILASVPLSVPRFFFQRLQRTDIKLAISPQALRAGEHVSVHYDTKFSLKVEGIIVKGSQQSLRRVNCVHVHVKSSQVSKSLTVPENVKIKENPTNEMAHTADVHNDYFSTEFLLSFPVTGIHLITIDNTVEDTSGELWDIGQKVTLNVKSYDEAVQRQQQHQYAAKRQQQRSQQLASQFS